MAAPALNPRLGSARSKWERAKLHADQLVAAMKHACAGGSPHVSKMGRHFDGSTNEIVWTAEEIVPEIDPDWGLMVGECIYNLRCALDHLWWELAIDHFGGEPPVSEAHRIQFPFLTDQGPEKFDKHRLHQHVSGEAAAKAKESQHYDRPTEAEPYLAILQRLSNEDRHRRIKPIFFRTGNVSVAMGPGNCVDCHPPKSEIDGAEWAETITYGDWEATRVGDEVLRREIVPTGPNPDIQDDPKIVGRIGFGSEESILGTLKHLGSLVHALLTDFAPLLKTESPGR